MGHMTPNDLKLLCGFTGLLIAGFGWVFYAIASSGAWSEVVMPKSRIKEHKIFAIIATCIGALLYILPFIL